MKKEFGLIEQFVLDEARRRCEQHCHFDTVSTRIHVERNLPEFMNNIRFELKKGSVWRVFCNARMNFQNWHCWGYSTTKFGPDSDRFKSAIMRALKKLEKHYWWRKAIAGFEAARKHETLSMEERKSVKSILVVRNCNPCVCDDVWKLPNTGPRSGPEAAVDTWLEVVNDVIAARGK